MSLTLSVSMLAVGHLGSENLPPLLCGSMFLEELKDEMTYSNIINRSTGGSLSKKLSCSTTASAHSCDYVQS